MSRPQPVILSFALAALLACPALAAPARERLTPREPQPAATLVIRTLDFLTNLFGRNGGSLDPFGTPTPSVEATTPSGPGAQGDSADNGGSLDPFGG